MFSGLFCGVRTPQVIELQAGTALSFSFPALMLFARFLWEFFGESTANGWNII
jgi:hypothetical protein